MTLKPGTYTFVCDPHSSQMHGTLTVTEPDPNAYIPRRKSVQKPNLRMPGIWHNWSETDGMLTTHNEENR